MKKLFRNKKVFVGAVTIMIGVSLLMAGLSYAWFNLSGAGDNTNVITIGAIEIEAEVEANNTVLNATVDTVWDQEGYVKNNGSTDAFVKLIFSAETTKTYGLDGKPIANPNDYTVDLNDVNVSVVLQSAGLDGVWYYQNLSTGKFEYFVNLAGGANYDFLYAVMFDLANMEADYMGAQIKINISYEATQAVDEAINAKFGFSDWWTDLAPIDDGLYPY